MIANNIKAFIFWGGIVSISPLLFATQMVKAQSQEVIECRLVKDNIERLACFDGLSNVPADTKATKIEPDRIKDVDDGNNLNKNASKSNDREPDDIDKRAQALMAKSKTSQAPLSENRPSIPVNRQRSSTAANGFGSEQLSGEKAQEINEIQTRIVSLVTDSRGFGTITLANDQVWRQTETSRFTVKEEDIVSIEKGVLGSYYLAKSGNNRRMRVKRIK
jgi:hypothetical protein